jgi:hypothetical protein
MLSFIQLWNKILYTAAFCSIFYMNYTLMHTSKCSTSLKSTPWTQQGDIKNKRAWLLQYEFLNLNPVTAVDIVHINENIMLPDIHWYSHKHTAVKFNHHSTQILLLCALGLLFLYNISNEVQSYGNNSLRVVQVFVFH